MASIIMLRFVLAMLALASPSRAATIDDWRSRSIYQVLTDRFALTDGSTTSKCDPARGTYCGGSYKGIIQNLDYIQGMGFTAVWVSPITYQLQQDTFEGEAYHGYWQQNLYALNENFGTEADLKALSKALHLRGMYLMVDVVVNHFGWAGQEQTVDYSQLYPFDDEQYFHSYCSLTTITNATNTYNCWLGDTTVSLPDVRTESPLVESMLNAWISSLVSNYTIDGLRIDSILNVEPKFFPNWTSAAGVFAIGEGAYGVTSDVCSYQDYIDSVLNYPVYFPLIRAFVAPNGSISDLVSEMSSVHSACRDTTVLGSFSENHDQPRFASFTSDISQAMNVITYSMLADGIPIIYEGQEQHYAGGITPLNREDIWSSGYDRGSILYNHITLLNSIRSHAITTGTNYSTYNNYVSYSDDNTLGMRKGFNGSQTITVLSNLGAEGVRYTLNLTGSGFAVGEELTELLSCGTAIVDANGDVALPMQSGLPRILYPSALLPGSGFCGATGTPTTTSGSPPSASSTAKGGSSALVARPLYSTFMLLWAVGAFFLLEVTVLDLFI